MLNIAVGIWKNQVFRQKLEIGATHMFQKCQDLADNLVERYHSGIFVFENMMSKWINVFLIIDTDEFNFKK